MRIMAHDRTDDELAKGIASLEECDRLIRKLKRQRTWFPLLGLCGLMLIVIASVALQERLFRSDALLPTGVLAYAVSMMTFCAAVILFGLNQLDCRIKCLLIVRALHENRK